MELKQLELMKTIASFITDITCNYWCYKHQNLLLYSWTVCQIHNRFRWWKDSSKPLSFLKLYAYANYSYLLSNITNINTTCIPLFLLSQVSGQTSAFISICYDMNFIQERREIFETLNHVERKLLTIFSSWLWYYWN